LTIALIWPALVNGGPFFFPDTRTYIRGADTAVAKLTHRHTVWTAAEEGPAAGGARQTVQDSEQALHNIGEARTRSLTEIGKKGILLGRSPYYGMLLYGGVITGGFWLTILIQAWVMLLAVYLTLRALRRPVWPSLAYVGLGLCLVPAAPLFVSYLMPDLFAGVAILACGVLLSIRERWARRDAVLWYLLLSAAMLFHDSCALIVVSLFGFGLVLNLLRRPHPVAQTNALCVRWPNWRGLSIILLAGMTAWAGQTLVEFGAQRATGKAPLRLPFLSARLVADGPGTNYLRANCPQSHFALCDYAAEMPLLDAEFLFGTQPGRSVFEVASYDQRRAISQEQFRFFLAVLRYDPAGVLRTSVRDAGEQLLDFRLNTFRYDPGMKDVMDRTFPVSVLARVQASASYRGTLPIRTLSVILYGLVFGSLGYLLAVLSGRWRKRTMSADLKRMFGWVCVGIVVNAGVCGALSAIDSRYQARVIWLIPMMAMLVELQAWTRGRRSE